MPESQSQEQQPLSGYRVLDLSGPMGVYCGKLMADVGADVIKIEPPGGDLMRRIGPFVHDEPHPERSLYWAHFNTNKGGITLDITTTEGTDLFLRLVREADVVLETYPPGFLDSLGLGYPQLSGLNPGLVYVSVTPFGQTGPYKGYKASDLVGFAMGGFMYITGWPHTPPTRLWGSQAYHTASNWAFVASLLALYDRLNTGLGQHVDVSMQEAVTMSTQHVNAAYAYEGRTYVRAGFLHTGQMVCTWKCMDGYCSITTNTRRAWDELRTWMAEEGLVGELMDEKYDDHFILRGTDVVEQIDGQIGKWAMHHTRHEVHDWGQSRHHPFGYAATPSEMIENSQLWDRGFFTKVEHPELDAAFVYPGAPYKLSDSPWKLRSEAPAIGQHNTDVYRDELGLSFEELETLGFGGVI